MSASVRLEGLRVAFSGQEVLHGIDAFFPATGVSALLGRSGSGKSTLLRSINRLNEEFPGCATSGRVLVDFGSGPVDVYSLPESGAKNGLSVHGLRTRLGMLFQTPNLFPVSVLRNIAMPLKLVGGADQKSIFATAQMVLQQVGLWDELKDRLHAPAAELSGGQQQRLCLARLLALKPSVLLLDEPTASLDVHASKEIEELLQGLAANYSIIMVSHSLAQARRMSGRMLICEQGRITSELAPDASVSEETLAALL
ncbi:phosphate ABC transporter ATP-binding protein [Desulfovibrio sp. OttesenSCG-928-G15]|nr:phosphate ABC transporter ATP-binding protein [Desulfovibrio sp. OttesenSCG-928-G15]